MAKIIYKNGYAGQNKLSCIKGIEIELLNSQKALIYPRYAVRQILTPEQIRKWNAKNQTEIEALKRISTALETECLCEIGSPAAQWVSQFKYGIYSNFALPSLLAAMEIQYQKAEIDALAKTIEEADLLRNYPSFTLSCSRSSEHGCWVASINGTYAGGTYTDQPCLVIPTILYK